MAFDNDKKRPARKPAGGARTEDSGAKGKAGGKPFGKPAGKDFGKPYGKPGGKPTGKPAFKSDRPRSDERPAAAKPAAVASGVEPERISKLLARAGVASRRDVERMIMEGRIRLNG
jgi:23S rRNA pseudouridine2605 synthase